MMKHFPLTALLSAAALLASAPAHALPAAGPLLTAGTTFGAILSPPQTALSALLDAPPAPPASGPPALLLPLWALGASYWNPALDPSLRLGDWRHVFDIAALGHFDIPLRDDPAERTNILLSAQAIDAATVAPGAEFSFNERVGERTPERGYRDGLMFDNGRVVRGTGGGICLVATGLYNAALHAGLAIEERHPHSGIVSYAAPGCDAGIVYGQEDLRFRNTTGRTLVIRATPEEDRVAVRLFGRTPTPGHQVIVKPLSLAFLAAPVVTKLDPTLPPGTTVVDQKPRRGYDVVVARFWTVQGRIVRREIVARERRAPRPELRRVALPPVLPSILPSALPASPALLSSPGLPALVGPDLPAAAPKTDAGG